MGPPGLDAEARGTESRRSRRAKPPRDQRIRRASRRRNRVKLQLLRNDSSETVEDPTRGAGSDLRARREGLGASVDDVHPLQVEQIERRPGRPRQRRRGCSFGLETPAPAAPYPQPVDLRTGMRGPEEALLRSPSAARHTPAGFLRTGASPSNSLSGIPGAIHPSDCRPFPRTSLSVSGAGRSGFHRSIGGRLAAAGSTT